MSQTIACYTLFDITQTGILNRTITSGNEMTDWIKKRNSQCNFDTILQVISLRSQPEVITIPMPVIKYDVDYFGFLYNKDDINVWKFIFEVQHPSVFTNNVDVFGYLYQDCEGVPMINDNDSVCPKFLNTKPELKNIHFEVV